MLGEHFARVQGAGVKIQRPWLLLTLILLSVGVALATRDAVRDVVVLPLAYLLWRLRALLAGVAQLVQWAVLVSALTLVMAWQLVPRLKRPSRSAPRARGTTGPVEEAAIGVLNARSGHYFRWQLAHRLGVAARRLAEISAGDAAGPPSSPVSEYLAAGVDHSFVEFSSRPHSFSRRTRTALDIDPGDVLAYLEAQCLPEGAAIAEHR